MKHINDIPKEDRPREKLLAKGVSVLSNQELLQVIIGSGVKGHDVVKISNDLSELLEFYDGKINMEQLKEIKGIGLATSTKLLASLEIASRFIKTGIKINRVEDVALLLSDIRTKKQEHFVLITLDGANRLINKHIITIGTLNSSMVHPRDIFYHAINDNAANIIVCHNHPSGSLEPSNADIEITKRLIQAGKLIGIPLQSHIILTKNDWTII